MNIGKTKVTPPEHAVADYAESARLVGPLADFLVVNVSSPNTPGLRDLQAVESLRPILAAVRPRPRPRCSSRSPPTSPTPTSTRSPTWPSNSASRDRRHQHHGVPRRARDPRRGRTRARRRLRTTRRAALAEVLRRLYRRVGDRLVLISVGGIETVDDAWERITSGASLVQGYTGLRLRRRAVGQAHSRRRGTATARRRLRDACRRRRLGHSLVRNGAKPRRLRRRVPRLRLRSRPRRPRRGRRASVPDGDRRSSGLGRCPGAVAGSIG